MHPLTITVLSICIIWVLGAILFFKKIFTKKEDVGFLMFIYKLTFYSFVFLVAVFGLFFLFDNLIPTCTISGGILAFLMWYIYLPFLLVGLSISIWGVEKLLSRAKR